MGSPTMSDSVSLKYPVREGSERFLLLAIKSACANHVVGVGVGCFFFFFKKQSLEIRFQTPVLG